MGWFHTSQNSFHVSQKRRSKQLGGKKRDKIKFQMEDFTSSTCSYFQNLPKLQSHTSNPGEKSLQMSSLPKARALKCSCESYELCTLESWPTCTRRIKVEIPCLERKVVIQRAIFHFHVSESACELSRCLELGPAPQLEPCGMVQSFQNTKYESSPATTHTHLERLMTKFPKTAFATC